MEIPSDKLTVHYGKSQFLMAQSTISMAIFNSKLLNYPRLEWFQEKSTRKYVPFPMQQVSFVMGMRAPKAN